MKYSEAMLKGFEMVGGKQCKDWFHEGIDPANPSAVCANGAVCLAAPGRRTRERMAHARRVSDGNRGPRIRRSLPVVPRMSDFTSDDPRCLAVLQKLAQAKAKMKRHGIKTLLEGHKGWQKLNPMASPAPVATVVPIRKRK